MNIWKTLVALALAGGLCAYAYWGVYKGKEKKEAAEAADKKLLDVDKDPLRKVSIEIDGKTVTIALKAAPPDKTEEKKEEGDEKEAPPPPKADRDWEIVEPFAADADQSQARVVAGAFKTASREGKIEGADLKLFGLDPPEIAVTVTTEGGKTETYAVGKKSPVGYKNYVKVGSTGEIALVGGAFRSSLDKDLADLRDKRLFLFKREDVRKVEVARAEAAPYVLEQKDGKWTLAAPTEAKASSTEAGKILTALTGLRVEEFASENEPDPAGRGLDAPRMTVTVTAGESQAAETVRIGGEAGADKAYAMREGRPNLYVVKDKILKDLDKAPNDLRENKPVSARKWDVARIALAGPGVQATLAKEASGEWTVESEDGKPKADKKKVEDLLTALVDLKAPGFVDGKPEDLAPYGLVQPWYTVTLSKVVKAPTVTDAEGEEKSAEADKIEVLSTLQLGDQAEGSMYAKEAGEPWVYRIDAAFGDKLPAKAADLIPPPPPPAEVAAPEGEAPSEGAASAPPPAEAAPPGPG